MSLTHFLDFVEHKMLVPSRYFVNCNILITTSLAAEHCHHLEHSVFLMRKMLV